VLVMEVLMTALELFSEGSCGSFESFSQNNGNTSWYARDLMNMLGYENFDSFEGACINKAIGACTTLRIPVLENFQQVDRDLAGRIVRDYKLSRFACYLTAMNGDVKKPAVAAAQAYFASMAEAVRKQSDLARKRFHNGGVRRRGTEPSGGRRYF